MTTADEMSAMTHESHLRPGNPPHIAVLLFSEVQLLDMAGIDLFGMMSTTYLRACSLPAPLLAQATDFRITYASAAAAHTPATLTASAALLTSASLSDASVSAGKVDVLLIPGPPPGYAATPAERSFMRAHADAGAYILTVCTGAYPAGQAGVFAGRRATAPRGLPRLDGAFAGVTHVDARWCADGRVWSSGGIANGLEMVAAFLRAVYPGPVVDVVLAMADVGGRGQEYGEGKVKTGGVFVWAILRAVFMGLVGAGGAGKKGREVEASAKAK